MGDYYYFNSSSLNEDLTAKTGEFTDFQVLLSTLVVRENITQNNICKAQKKSGLNNWVFIKYSYSKDYTYPDLMSF